MWQAARTVPRDGGEGRQRNQEQSAASGRGAIRGGKARRARKEHRNRLTMEEYPSASKNRIVQNDQPSCSRSVDGEDNGPSEPVRAADARRRRRKQALSPCHLRPRARCDRDRIVSRPAKSLYCWAAVAAVLQRAPAALLSSLLG